MADVQLENGYLRIANDIQSALCKIRIPGESRQIFDVIIRKTYGYGKSSDIISLSQFCELTGLPKVSVCRSIKTLLKMKLINKNGNGYNKTYEITKDFDKWKPLTRKKPLTKTLKKINKNVKEELTKMTHTKDNITKDNTKDNTTIVPKSPAHTPQADFVNSFKAYYNSKGGKYKANASDYIVMAKLIAEFGIDICVEKAKILADCCENKSVWFTKQGWSDFTIGKMCKFWNELLKSNTNSKWDEIFKSQEELNAKVRAAING